MSKEILQAVEVVSNEKEISPDEVFTALEAALAAAVARRKFDGEADIEVDIDRETGDMKAYRRWEVLDGSDEEAQMEFPDSQLWLIDAEEIQADIKPGEHIKKEVEMVNGRIAAQVVMQTIKQKLRESERNKLIAEFEGKENELVYGTIKKNLGNRLIIDMGSNVEAVVPREMQIPNDSKRSGDPIRGILTEIKDEGRTPQLMLSRSSNKFIEELFKIEVPEIAEGMIDIMGAARDPGIRAKVAVLSNDSRLDPVGACVGIRGARVQAISDELAGEKIDIVIWDENEVKFVINALTPADVVKVSVDEELHEMNIAVPDKDLSKAIGKNGQNVRLASILTGWTLNVMDESSFNAETEEESKKEIQTLMGQLDVEEDVAAILVDEGLLTVEEIAFAGESRLEQIEEFDAEIAGELKVRAQDVLLIREIALEESIEEHAPSQELLAMEGMDERTAYLLASKNIITVEDLAEQSVDEVRDIESMELDEKTIANLIMKAREPWFQDENDKGGRE